MRRAIIYTVLLLVAAAAVTYGRRAPIETPWASRAVLPVTTSGCLPDPTEDATLAHLRELVSDTSAYGAESRARWHLPVASESEVSVVSDSATCAVARDAFNAQIDAADSVSHVRVFRVRDVRVVETPTTVTSEWGLYMIFDTTFTTLIAQILG